MLNKIYKNRSVIVASLIAVLSLLWVMSGTDNSGHEGDAETSEVEKAVPLVKVAVEQRQATKTWHWFEGSGDVEPKRAVDVLSGLEGRIVAINTEEGQTVAKDTVLIELTPKHIPQQRLLAKARVEQAKLEYQAAKRLAAKGLQNQLKVAEAKSALASAEADLAGAEVAVSELKLRAPFEAVVQTIDVELGDLIRVGERGVRLVQMDQMIATVSVMADVAAQLQPGLEVTVSDRRNNSFKASLKYVSTEPDKQSRMYRVEATLQPGAAVVIGQPVSLRIPLKEVTAHKVPTALLWLNAEGEMGVRGLDSNNVVTFYPAKFLRSEGGDVWLTELPETLTLIVGGHGLVRTGSTAEPIASNNAQSAQ